MAVDDTHEEYEFVQVSRKQPQFVDEEWRIQPKHVKSMGMKSAATSNSGTSAPLVPNGGRQAWLQVLGSWMLFFFGVFQTYYESGAIFRSSSSDISWIGSIQALMALIVGAFSGPIYDRGGFRWLLIVGSFAVVFGHMMLSFCETYRGALLAQGFLIGIGGGCLYVPAVAIMPTYFTTRLGLALGLAASGSSTGGIIYPIIFFKLINQVGFGWSVRILGFTALVTLIVPLAVMEMRVTPGKVRSLIDWTAFTDWPYMTFVIGCFVGFIGLYITFFYISYFEQASGAVMVGLLLFCNIAVRNVGGIIVTTLFLGFFTGVFVALPPALFVALTNDKSKIGTRIGMGLALAGLGALAG
ncbi:MAG: hypothetical protein Q9225_007213 [Loekoesia sp. 1 TL-2023]